MNEFIVWDNVSKLFFNNEEFKIHNGKCVELFDSEWFKNDYPEHTKIFNYIGKTDTEGNKIYADCSIVEFDTEKHGKQRGFFTYSKMFLSYIIEDLYNDMGYLRYDGSQTNLKVIGTLQEGKHLQEVK